MTKSLSWALVSLPFGHSSLKNWFFYVMPILPELSEPLKYFFFREVGVLEAKVEVFRSQVEGRGEKMALQLEAYTGIYQKISMFIISGHILTFSTGSAGLRTNSSDSLLNRNSSFGRPSFFNSYNVWLYISFGKRIPPCPAPVYQLVPIF